MSFIVKALEILNRIPEPLRSLFIVLGIIYVVHQSLKFLMRTFKTVESIVRHAKLKVYYPIVSRIVKRKHKDYVKEYLRSLVPSHPSITGFGLEYDVDIEWSDEERVLLDLERGILLVRMPYTTNLQQVIAKALLMSSPYVVSQYLEPLFGPKLAQLLSVSIAREYASKDVNVLKEFIRYVHEVFEENKEFKSLMEYINRADDESLYKHIVLFELRKILETYNGQIDRNKLESDVKELIKIVGALHNIREPMVCGHYIFITIVRVGKLEKILLEEWNRYVQFIKTCMQKCNTLRRIYIVSAGKYIRNVAKKLVDYIVSNVGGIKLINQVSYRARYYRGRPGIVRFIAVFEIE